MILPTQPQQFNKQQREKRTNPMKRTIERLTRAAILAVAFILCATDQAWAAGDTAPNVTLTGTSVNINNVGQAASASGNHYEITAPSGTTITLPASGGLTDYTGCRIAVHSIKFARSNAELEANKISIITDTGTLLSDIVAASDTADGEIETGYKTLTYSFSKAPVLKIGTEYHVKFLDSNGDEISGKIKYRSAPVTQSIFSINIRHNGGSHVYLYKLEGELYYTCAVAAGGSSSWVASQTGSSTDCRWYDVTGSPSFDIGTVSCDTAYFNVAASQTLTLTGGSITAANAVKSVGAGNVVFDASRLDVSSLSAGEGLKVTSGATAADVADVSVVNLPAAGASLKYVVQQRSDGYYIAALPKDCDWNTININFTHDGNNLSTESNVGMIGVPGNKWNNYVAAASASYAGASICDDTGTQTQALTGLDVAISEALGSYQASSLSPSSDLRHGYIDDRNEDGKRTPTVEISGIPFEKYRVIVYHSTETANTTFGYDTVNGDNLYYVDGVLVNGSGRTSWGNSGPSNSADPIEEGVNTLITGVYTAKPLTVVGHMYNRGCIAAVQVVNVDEATIDAAGTYTLAGLFGSVGTTANFYINVTENATLNIPSDTTIAAIDLNIATGKTLTLTGAKLTATTGGFTVSGGGKVLIDVVNPVNYWAKVVEGRVYGAEDIDLTSTADGAAQLEIDQADGVCINVADEAASFARGLNSYLTGTYVTSSAQTAFSGITLQQFYDGGYTLRGRFAGANINKLGVEATGYNAYVTDDGAGNVTSIRYEMQVINGGWIKCIVVTLTPDAGGTGINVVANGAYYAAESNGLGFAFLNDDGTTKDGVIGVNLGVAYNTSGSYSLYGLNIVGKSTKSLTLSGDETLTVGTDIASAYSTMTVSGSGSLTISGILNVDTLVVKSGASVTLADNFGARNISIESGATVSYVGGDGSSFYWATLSGAGTLALDPGEGNTYTMSGSNTGYTGEAVIKSGTVKMGDVKSFGAFGRSAAIRVKGGAALDENGVTDGNLSYGSEKNKVILEDGATLTTSKGDADGKWGPFTTLTLEGDATVDANDGAVALCHGYVYSRSTIELNGHTLTKTGNYNFFVGCPNITGSGVFRIKEGSVSICNTYYSGNNPTCTSGAIMIDPGASLVFKFYRTDELYPVLTVKDIILNGSITRDHASSALTVTGYISGTGTTPMLTLADGATLKPMSNTAGLTVSESLTLNGTIKVDLSEVDLTGKSDLAIITGPTQIDKDDDVDTFNLGSNSANWELYSKEVSTGEYTLGVRLKTIESSVSWDGETGTWSVNSFNGGTENYSNQALQAVTFADNGESTDPIAVTVSGAKTVNALNFTADNRNITLSGDPITADTVSKSGDGVAIINSDLSVATSISVTDGVLVLNPTDAVVADEWTESDNGTLVVYVDSGETTTMTAAITATKLIKRGAGTLDLTGVTVTSIPIVVDGGTVIVDEQPSAKVTINASGTFTLKDAVWSNGTLFSGDGTLELLSTKDITHTATGSTFNGIFKLSNQSDKQNNLNPSSVSMFDASVRPEFVCDSTSTHLGDGWNNNNTIAVRDFSGSGNIRSQWNNLAYHYTIETKQTKNTTFDGTLVSAAYSYNRYIDLSVIGDGSGDIHSLTISKAQNSDDGSSSALSTLTVSGNAKVVFTPDGGWGHGKVSIGANGVLESQRDAQVVGALTLEAGSTLAFGNGSQAIQASGALTTPAEGKVTIDVSGLTIAANASKTLLTVGSGMPANVYSKFSLNSGTHMLSVSGQTLSLVPIAATVTTSTGTMPYATLDGAVGGLAACSVANPDAYVTLVNATTSDLTISADVLAEYHIVYDESDGTYGFAAAEITSTQYTTVAKAIAGAADSGDTITLLRDCSIENLSLGGKSITLNEGDYTFTGSFTGSGTLIMTAMPKELATARWAAGWTGTLWLKGCNFAKGSYNPINFGTASSSLRLTGCTGCFDETYLFTGDNVAKYTFEGTLELQDDGATPALTITDGFPNHGKTVFGKLTGDGTLTCSSTSGHYYQFKDASDFVGTITVPTGDGNNFRVALGDVDATVNNADSVARKTITVQAGASAAVAAGKTWTAPGGITIDGNLSIANTGVLTGTIKGGGTITYAALPASAPTFGAWTGAVVLPTISSGELNFNAYGVEGSVVRVSSITGGYLPAAVITPTIDIPNGASITLDAFSPTRINVIKAITGAGTLALNVTATEGNDLLDVGSWASWKGNDGYSAYLRIGDVSGFSGSLSPGTSTGIVIGNDKPAYNTVGGKIILNSGKAATVGASATWTATTIQVGGDLSVAAGGTLSGEVEILSGGSLESTNNTALTSLKLNDGAKIVFPTASSTLTGITSVAFASGTTTLALADGQATGTLIDWSGASLESAPAGDFQIEGEAAGLYVVTKNTSGLSIAAAAARIGDTAYATVDSAIEYLAGHRDALVEVLDDDWRESDSAYYAVLGGYGIIYNSTAHTYAYAEANISTKPTSYYATIDEALSAAASGDIKTVNLNKNLTTNPVLPAGVSLNLGNYTLTGTVTAAAGYVPSKRTVDGKTVYTADPDTTGESWTDGSGDHAWNNPDNWSLGFVPVANTPVTFPAGTHTVNLATNNGTEKCGAMTVTGNVTFQRANAGTWSYVQLNGNVSGDGTLTLVHVGLGAPTDINPMISCPVVVDGTDGKDALCYSGGKTFTFSNTVTVSGQFKGHESWMVFNGLVTLNNGGEVYAYHSYYRVDISFNGGLTIPANAAVSLTRTSSGYHHIASAVTLNLGSRLTVPDDTTTSGATFAAWSPLYNVVRAAGASSTTVYSVEKKPGTIFSVW